MVDKKKDPYEAYEAARKRIMEGKTRAQRVLIRAGMGEVFNYGKIIKTKRDNRLRKTFTEAVKNIKGGDSVRKNTYAFSKVVLKRAINMAKMVVNTTVRIVASAGKVDEITACMEMDKMRKGGLAESLAAKPASKPYSVPDFMKIGGRR